MFCRIEESKCNPAILSQWVHETADWPPWFYIPRPSRAPIAMEFRDCDGIAVGFRIVAGLGRDLVLLVWAVKWLAVGFCHSCGGVAGWLEE